MCQHFISNLTHRWTGRVPNEIHRGNLWSKMLLVFSPFILRGSSPSSAGSCSGRRLVQFSTASNPPSPTSQPRSTPICSTTKHRCLLQRGVTSPVDGLPRLCGHCVHQRLRRLVDDVVFGIISTFDKTLYVDCLCLVASNKQQIQQQDFKKSLETFLQTRSTGGSRDG